MNTATQKGEIYAQSQGYGDHGGWTAFRAIEVEDGEYEYGPSYMGGTEQEAIDNLLADEAKAFEAYRAYVLSAKALMGDTNYEMMIEGA